MVKNAKGRYTIVYITKKIFLGRTNIGQNR